MLRGCMNISKIPAIAIHGLLKKSRFQYFTSFIYGRENIPAQKILKLSDSFIIQPETPTLELVVKLININYDKDSQILAR